MESEKWDGFRSKVGIYVQKLLTFRGFMVGSMENIQRQRVRERLDATGLNAFEAARRAGLHRSFLHDLLIGKKRSIREKYLPQLAPVLGCDPEYLVGRQSEVSRNAAGGAQPAAIPTPVGMETGSIPVIGRCEPGSWHDPAYPVPGVGKLTIEPDPRYPSTAQVGFVVYGDDAATIGIPDESLICIGLVDELKKYGRNLTIGDTVVVKNERNGTFEHTIRKYILEKGEYIFRSGGNNQGIPDTFPSENTVVIGIMLTSKKVF
ncbi:helix-turn-helix domain-containing protein [Amorphus sp. 3PC139-8]|uniref:helix-turn-helix domain-containing protein n=1 Tax=Amorphus sp. 3PC139-8 TaxID=2735676 RepID=UPI00345DC19E